MPDLRASIVDIEQARLDPAVAIAYVADPRFGGVALFLGRVRAQNLGRTVTGVAYEIFEPLALRIFQAIGERIRKEVDAPCKLYIAHARGDLQVGDPAVVIAAGTPHRDEAFRACRLAIEAVKHEAPIWKREQYVDGSSEWGQGCSLCGRG